MQTTRCLTACSDQFWLNALLVIIITCIHNIKHLLVSPETQSHKCCEHSYVYQFMRAASIKQTHINIYSISSMQMRWFITVTAWCKCRHGMFTCSNRSRHGSLLFLFIIITACHINIIKTQTSSEANRIPIFVPEWFSPKSVFKKFPKQNSNGTSNFRMCTTIVFTRFTLIVDSLGRL